MPRVANEANGFADELFFLSFFFLKSFMSFMFGFFGKKKGKCVDTHSIGQIKGERTKQKPTPKKKETKNVGNGWRKEEKKQNK